MHVEPPDICEGIHGQTDGHIGDKPGDGDACHESKQDSPEQAPHSALTTPNGPCEITRMRLPDSEPQQDGQERADEDHYDIHAQHWNADTVRLWRVEAQGLRANELLRHQPPLRHPQDAPEGESEMRPDLHGANRRESHTRWQGLKLLRLHSHTGVLGVVLLDRGKAHRSLVGGGATHAPRPCH